MFTNITRAGYHRQKIYFRILIYNVLKENIECILKRNIGIIQHHILKLLISSYY